MRSEVRAQGSVGDAERLWYDVSRWPAFVDGFARVARMDGEWPQHGSLVWDSRPGGRGRVVESVVRQVPGEGLQTAVEDEKLTGRQRVSFREAGGAVAIRLELDYELKRRPPGWWVVDALFIRRAVRDSLARTVRRFAIELEADRELAR